ncbi:MAG: formylglycine-generating enzyme family protein [Deltaproteobacteria bacterium]|nr:formylglycine-generating enzyme family protein [Deltaproteobacteria bacterium]
MLPAIVATLAAIPTSLTLAVLPCEPLHQARAEEAGWLDEKIVEDLSALVKLVPRERVLAALESRGVKGASACDDGCLTELGRELGVDRVVRQTLTIQRKMQSEGAEWIWVLHQVQVERGAAHGHFERAGVRPRTYWRAWSRELAQKLVLYNPATRVRLDEPAVSAPTAGPVEIPGMVYVPGGEFVMGSEWGEPDELPRHLVRVDPFYIGEHEVTVEDYRPCVEAGKCPKPCVWNDPKFNQPRQPVVCANWDDAVAFCGFSGGRLPTEAEWELAARGTDERRFPWGDDWHPEWVNQHTPDDGFETTAPVGSFPQNKSPCGAYDMAGNAWEWVQDFWDPGYYPLSPRDNPPGSAKGKRRVMRGGSWMYDVPFFVTTSNRSPGWPFRRKEYVGIRCAMDVPEQ